MQQTMKLGSIVKKNNHNICQHLVKIGFFYASKGTCIAKVEHIKLRMFPRKNNKIPDHHHCEWIDFPLFIPIKN
jgi:hypothetical protein